MENLYKIVSLASEVPVLQRRVPAIPWPAVLAIDYLGCVFGNYPTLRSVEAAQAAGELESRFGLSTSKGTLDLEHIFTNRNFISAFKDPSARLGIAHFILDLVRAGKKTEARTFLARYLENINIIGISAEERTALEFLQIQTADSPSRAWRGYFQRVTDPIAKYLCGINIGLKAIEEGRIPDASTLVTGLPSRITVTGSHPYPTIFIALLAGEVRFANMQYVEAAHEFEKAAKSARHWNGLDPTGTYTRLYSNLLIAAEARYAACMQKVNNPEQAAKALERIEAKMDIGLPFLLGEETLHALFLALGEHYFRSGNLTMAADYFHRTERDGKLGLHALTRLNETGKTTLAHLEDEKKARKNTFPSDHSDETTQILLAKYHLACILNLGNIAREALEELTALFSGTPLADIVLVFHASQSFADARLLRSVRLARIPEQMELTTPGQRLLALRLFGSADPAIFCASARQVKRELTHARSAESLSDLIKVTLNLQDQEMVAFYTAAETELRAQTDALFSASKAGRALLFTGEALNAYRLLDKAGIVSFGIKVDRTRHTAAVRLNCRGGFIELPFDANFAIAGSGDSQFDRLLSLVAVDCFLKIQLGESYPAVFERIDFKFFMESDYLNTEKLANRLDAALTHRPPSASEKELEKVAESATDAGISPSPSPDPESSGERRQIFSYRTYKKLLEPRKVVIDIPRLASLNPLARLLSAMEKEVVGQTVTLSLSFGQHAIKVNISRDGAISITDYNQGITNLDLIGALQEAVIDILNAHFSPQYRSGLEAADPRSRIHEIFMGVQNSAEARQKKWEIYEELRPGERLFDIQAPTTGENPFDSTFFELVEKPGEKPQLVPLPSMTAEHAARALRDEHRRIVQVGTVGIHRKSLQHPISVERLNYYIFRFVLGRRERVRTYTHDQLAEIGTIRTRILGGELTADPNHFLRPDPQEPGQITLDTILEVSRDAGGKSLRTHMTFARPHLRIFELVVSPSGTVRTSLGRKPSITTPVPIRKRRSASPSSQPPTPQPLPPNLPPASPKGEAIASGPQLHDETARQRAEIAVAVSRTLRELTQTHGMTFGSIGLRGRISAIRLTQIQNGDIAGNSEDLATLSKVLNEVVESKRRTTVKAKVRRIGIEEDEAGMQEVRRELGEEEGDLDE